MTNYEAAICFANKHKTRIVPFSSGDLINDRENVVPLVAWFNATSVSEYIKPNFTGPNAANNIGVPCGEINGIIAIDCDVKKGSNGVEQFLKMNRDFGTKPSHVYQDTPSGGRHYFYQYDPRCYRNKVRLTDRGKTLNIDVRTDGGYIRVDPINNTYRMHGLLYEAPPMPDWLIRLLQPKDDRPQINDFNTMGAVLRRCVKKVLEAPEGERNDTLNRMAYCAGRTFADDTGSHEMILEELVRSAESIGLPHREAQATASSGFTSGVRAGAWKDGAVPEEFRDVKDDDEVPQDLFLGRLPHPPLYVFPKSAGHVIAEMSEKRGIPPEMMVASMLSLCATCLGQGAQLFYDANWKEFANLYILTVGESGIGKTLAFNYMFEHMLEKQRILKKQWQKARDVYEQDMAKWKRKKNCDDPMPVPPKNTQFLIEDSTIEAAVDLLRENPRGLLWSIDETRKWFTRLDRYTNDSGEGKSKLLSGFDSKYLIVNRKTHDGLSNEVYLPSATFNFFGNIQPGFLKTLFTADDIEQGLPQRFLYVRAQMKKPNRYPLGEVDSECSKTLEKLTERLLSIGTEETDEPYVSAMGSVSRIRFRTMIPEQFVLTPAAKKIFDDHITFTTRMTFNLPSYSYAVKMSKILLRVVLILHLMEWACGDSMKPAKEIDFQTMSKAVELISWFMYHTARVRNFFPKEDRESGVASDSVVVQTVAQIILDHEDEIMDAPGRFIPNSTWTEWLKEEGLEISGKAIREIISKLHVADKRNAKARGKQFDDLCLEYCRRALRPATSLLGMTETDEEQYENAAYAWANRGRCKRSPVPPRPVSNKPEPKAYGIEACKLHLQELAEREKAAESSCETAAKACGDVLVEEAPEERYSSLPELKSASESLPGLESISEQAPALPGLESASESLPGLKSAPVPTAKMVRKPAPKLIPYKAGSADEKLMDSEEPVIFKRDETSANGLYKNLSPYAERDNRAYEDALAKKGIDPATGMSSSREMSKFTVNPDDDS